MTDHITTMFQLVDIIESLDKVQEWIDNARTAASTNQIVQLTLDRKQIEVDQKRMLVAGLMADIRNSN